MKTSYLDFFNLEDDKWEGFLISYWLNIQNEIMLRREKIDEDKIAEVIGLFIEQGLIMSRFRIPLKKTYKLFLFMKVDG